VDENIDPLFVLEGVGSGFDRGKIGNNAGLGSAKGGTTKDGFPVIMGTNHVGTFAFTEAVLPKILETARHHGEARIINLSSAAHQFARKFDPKTIFPPKKSMARDAYSESKLANLLHARELARRHGMHGLRAHAVHPGFVRSDFGRSEHFPGPWQAVFMLTRPLQISAAKGAKTTIAAAISDDAAWNNGLYWDKEKPIAATLPQKADQVAKDLWETTESILAEKGFVVERLDAIEEPMGMSDTSAFPEGL
ncbi:MAG: SDR family NAD(P)-dependent oxidoreductase, partial [Pseudomonadota bacterium]